MVKLNLVSEPIKIFLTIVALVLIFSGGVDLGLTTIPGVAILVAVWGLKL